HRRNQAYHQNSNEGRGGGTLREQAPVEKGTANVARRAARIGRSLGHFIARDLARARVAPRSSFASVNSARLSCRVIASTGSRARISLHAHCQAFFCSRCFGSAGMYLIASPLVPSVPPSVVGSGSARLPAA